MAAMQLNPAILEWSFDSLITAIGTLVKIALATAAVIRARGKKC